jgi:hypothetical protein
MKHMKHSRMMTTHKTTTELIDEGKIKPVKPKDKPDSKIDYLVIDEENEFNKIYNTLSEIENIMNIIFEPIRKYSEIHPLDQSKIDFDLANAFQILLEDYHGTFIQAFPILIQELLTRTNNKIDHEKDKQILNSRILQLQQKFIGIIGREEYTTSQKLGFFMARLGHIYSKAPFLARINKVDPNLLNECEAIARKFERVLEKFKNQFLVDSSTQQKSKKSHENL